MAQKVDKMPELERTFVSKYPWDEWLNGDIWELTENQDIPTAKTFQSTVQAAAKRRGMKARTRVKNGKLYVQARKEG